VTVTGVSLVAVDVTPANPTVPLGLGRPFTAVGHFADSTLTRPLTSEIQWSVSNPAVASVDAAGFVTTLAAGTTLVEATDVASSLSGSTTLTVTATTLTGVDVSLPRGAAAVCSYGDVLKLAATGVFGDGSKLPIADKLAFNWTSSDATRATVSSSGEVTCVDLDSPLVKPAPTVTITATDPGTGLSGSVTLTIDPSVVQSIQVEVAQVEAKSGATKTPALTLPVGASENFVATAFYGATAKGPTRGKIDITDVAAWTSSKPAVAVVTSSGESEGLVTGLTAGDTKIVATYSGRKGSVTLTVTDVAMTHLAIAPLNKTLAQGRTLQFTATGTFADKSTRDVTPSVTWTSSAPRIAISNASGTEGLATALAVGRGVIKATFAEIGSTGKVLEDATALTVTPATLVSLAVTPPSATLSPTIERQFSAYGTFSDATVVDLTDSVTWTSSVPTVATVSNAKGTSGLVTALAAGATSLFAFDAAAGISSAGATLTVSPATLTSLAISPASASIPLGLAEPFTAIGTFTDGSQRDLTSILTWSVTAGDATVSNAASTSGLATSATTGTSTILAEDAASGLTATATLTVTPAVLQSIAIAPLTVSAPAGLTQQLSATGTYSDGSTATLTTVVTWASAASAVAEVSNAAGSSGLLTTVSVGSTTVSATDPTTLLSAAVTVNVTPALLESLAITPAAAALIVGSTQPLTAMGTYSDGSSADVTTSVTWTSSDGTIAAVSNAPGSAGLVTAVSIGGATIMATDPATGVEGTASVTVMATVATISVTPSAPVIAPGQAVQLAATGTLSSGGTIDLTNDVTWSTSDSTIVSLSGAGLATGVDVGSAIITATSGSTGLTGSTVVTVAVADTLSVMLDFSTTEMFGGTVTVSDGTSSVTFTEADADATAAGMQVIKTFPESFLANATYTATITSLVQGNEGALIQCLLLPIGVTSNDPGFMTCNNFYQSETGTMSASNVALDLWCFDICNCNFGGCSGPGE